MPDTYIEVGDMAYSKDPSKVAARFTAKAKDQMRAAAQEAIAAAKGYTTDPAAGRCGI